eukprot:7789267-Prorocentrum_lima.AAC.1
MGARNNFSNQNQEQDFVPNSHRGQDDLIKQESAHTRDLETCERRSQPSPGGLIHVGVSPQLALG